MQSAWIPIERKVKGFERKKAYINSRWGERNGRRVKGEQERKI